MLTKYSYRWLVLYHQRYIINTSLCFILAVKLQYTFFFVAVCVYRQKKYVQGQSWADGQDYHCSCIDASIGEYKCTEM